MKNLSGEANYSSNQSLAEEKRLKNLKESKKESKKKVTPIVGFDTIELQQEEIKNMSNDLHNLINELYKVKPTKEIYDGIVTAYELTRIFV